MKFVIAKMLDENNNPIFLKQINYKNKEELELLEKTLNLEEEFKEVDVDKLFKTLLKIRKSYDIDEIKDDFCKEIKEENITNIYNNLLKASNVYYKQVDFLFYFLAPFTKIEDDKIKLLDNLKLLINASDISLDS